MRWAALAVLAGCGRIAFDPQTSAGDAGADATGSDGGGGSAAIEFVQAKSAGSNNAITFTLAWTSPVTAGDLLIIGIDYGDITTPTVASVTDDLADTWTLAGPTTGYSREYVAYAIANASGADTAHVSLSATVPYLELRLHEYRGVSATSPFDTFFGNSVDTMPATVTVTTHTPNQLVFVMTIFVAATVPSMGTGFTLRDSYAGDATEDRIVPMPSTFAATTEYSLFSQWTTMAAIFNPG